MGSTMLLFLFVFHLTSSLVAAQKLGPLYCEDKDGTYTNNSVYRENLDKVLLDITSDTTIDYGFYNFSSGQGSDTVNGIGLCRGDVTPADCRLCLGGASVSIRELCPNRMNAVGWSESGLCMLRYSNYSIFGTMAGMPAYSIFFGTNTFAGLKFNETLGTLLVGLQANASAGNSTRKYEAGSALVTNVDSVFAYVQCTPDLSSMDCSNCLGGSIRWIRESFVLSKSAVVVRPSCNVKFDLEEFVNEDTAPSSLSPGNSSSWILNCRGFARFGLLAALIMIIL